MDSNFHVDLLPEEVFVLAGLLGHKTVFGVNDATSLVQKSDLGKQVKTMVRQLERKKLIRYDLDGTLFLSQPLRHCVDSLCQPDVVGQFSTNVKGGKRATVSVLKKGDCTTLVEPTGKRKYRIRKLDDTGASHVIPKAVLGGSVGRMKEKMLWEEAVSVQEALTAFDRERAVARLQNCVTEEGSVGVLSPILSGGCPYFSAHIYQRNAAAYRSVFHSLIALPDHQAVAVSADENDVVNFISEDPHELCRQMEHWFGIQKGGDV